MDSYNQNIKIKILDFSSLEPDYKVYAMIIGKDGETKKVLFEPNETMLNDFKRMAPGKVFLD
jgi:hypothetical protein